MFGGDFEPATMRTFTGSVSTGCGNATSQVGPFYCPVDSTIYMDTSFFDEVLEQQFGGPEGAFVEPYVLAHEYGHHIQNLMGTHGSAESRMRWFQVGLSEGNLEACDTWAVDTP